MNDFPFRRVSMNLRYRILTAEYTCLSRPPIRIWVESELIVGATLEPSSRICERATQVSGKKELMGGKSYLIDLQSHTFTTSAKFDFCLKPVEETPQESTL